MYLTDDFTAPVKACTVPAPSLPLVWPERSTDPYYADAIATFDNATARNDQFGKTSKLTFNLDVPVIEHYVVVDFTYMLDEDVWKHVQVTLGFAGETAFAIETFKNAVCPYWTSEISFLPGHPDPAMCVAPPQDLADLPEVAVTYHRYDPF